jgi:hypothetical protein
MSWFGFGSSKPAEPPPAKFGGFNGSNELDPEAKLKVMNAKFEVIGVTEMLNRSCGFKRNGH